MCLSKSGTCKSSGHIIFSSMFYVHPYWRHFKLAFASVLSLWAYCVKWGNGFVVLGYLFYVFSLIPQGEDWALKNWFNPATYYCVCAKPGTRSPVLVVLLLVINCYSFTIFALDYVDCRVLCIVLCIVSQFVFRGLLQLQPVHCGRTFRSFNLTVTWWVDISRTIMKRITVRYLSRSSKI